MNKTIKNIFIFQLTLFFVVFLLLFTELQEFFPLSPVISIILFSLMGIVFVFLVRKRIKKGKVKKILIMNGLSAFGIMFFSILHNLFYAIGEISGEGFLKGVIDVVGGTVFIIGVVISPLVFLGTAVFVVFDFKNQKKEDSKKD